MVTGLRRLMKMLVPVRCRALLREQHRTLVFARAMHRFTNDPAGAIRPGSSVIADLVYGWGNEGWSALDDYLVACIRAALTVDGPVLECGSGLSTILLGAIAQRRGQTHWALEHVPQWASRVQAELDRFGIRAATVCMKPLKGYGEIVWYDPPLAQLPDAFSLVVCDGPPGTTAGGRYGLVPVMKARLKPGCILLLDDAAREEERNVARRWQAELSASFVVLGESKPYLHMVLP